MSMCHEKRNRVLTVPECLWDSQMLHCCLFPDKACRCVTASCLTAETVDPKPMTCRALAVSEGELQRVGEQIAEYQNVNRDLTAQADESRQHLQVVPAMHAWCLVMTFVGPWNDHLQCLICIWWSVQRCLTQEA